MKKLFLATCLMVSVIFTSFAGATKNYIDMMQYSFTFTSDGAYELLFGV